MVHVPPQIDEQRLASITKNIKKIERPACRSGNRTAMPVEPAVMARTFKQITGALYRAPQMRAPVAHGKEAPVVTYKEKMHFRVMNYLSGSVLSWFPNGKDG
jgi:hypothetical protein